MLITLKISFIEISYTQKELIELGMGVASGKLREKDIASWIDEHILKKA